MLVGSQGSRGALAPFTGQWLLAGSSAEDLSRPGGNILMQRGGIWARSAATEAVLLCGRSSCRPPAQQPELSPRLSRSEGGWPPE